MSHERQSEKYMRMVVELLHGVALQRFDCAGRQGAVDYVFTSPIANGAVEITTYQDSRAAAWFTKLDSSQIIECDSPRGWVVTIEFGIKLDQLKQRLPSVLAACDRYGVDHPDRVPATEWDPELQWFISTGLNLYPSPAAQPGTVRLQMPPTVGFPSNEGLDNDLERLLSDANIATKVRKLREHSGVTERHLAVGIDWYGPGFDLIDNLLKKRGYVPQYVPPDDFAATHVWLSGGGWDVLTWTRPGGWVWRPLPKT